MLEIIQRMPLRDDRKYVTEQLNQYPTECRAGILKGYLREWKEARDSEPVSYRKQNAGRYRANKWLRETEHYRHTYLERND